jgi:hypothetical protein
VGTDHGGADEAGGGAAIQLEAGAVLARGRAGAGQSLGIWTSRRRDATRGSFSLVRSRSPELLLVCSA